MRKPVLLAALALTAGSPLPAAAQEPAGSEFRVNSFVRANVPDVAAGREGGFVVAWPGFDGQTFRIAARRFDRFGNPRGLETVVKASAPSALTDAAVAADASGRFVVAWSAWPQDGSEAGIVARRFDDAGMALDAVEFQVNAYTTSHQIRPALALDASGNFVVVWDSMGQDGSGWGLFARRFDAGGTPLGGEFAVNEFTSGMQGRASVAATPDGGFVVAWESEHQDGNAYAIMARRFDAAGLPLGPEFQVNSYTTGHQMLADVAVDGTGGMVVTWGSHVQDGSGWGVFGQRLDASGAPLGAEFQVNTFTTGFQTYPTVARDADGAFMVSWYGRGPAADTEYDIFGRQYDATGLPVGEPFRVNTHTNGSQRSSSAAALGSGNFVVAWYHFPGEAIAQRYGERLFGDGFETGDVSYWDASAGGGDLTVSGEAAQRPTTYGLRAFVDDAEPLYLEDRTPNGEHRYRARFYLEPHDFDPGEAQGHFRTRVFTALQESPSRRVFALVLRRQGGAYGLMGRVRRDDGSHAETGFLAVSAVSHAVEIRWVRASGPSAGDGLFEMWIDGRPVASLTTIDNDEAVIDFVRMGALSLKTGASGTLHFDEFESRRDTPIGP
jgi:hypothetical protein